MIMKKYLLFLICFFICCKDILAVADNLDEELKISMGPNSSLYILGTSKNIERGHLAGLELNIQLMAESFSNYQVIIFANPSSFSVMSDTWRNRSNIHMFKAKAHERSKYRTFRLASLRNELIIEARKLLVLRGDSPDNTYVAMMDLDDVMVSPIIKRNFQTVLNSTNKWDVVSINRQPQNMTLVRFEGYYDIWALRYKRFNLNIASEPEGKLVPIIRSDIIDQLATSKDDFYPVYSAFNGMAIYKYNIFVEGCKYDGSSSERGIIEDCEHVSFHICLNERGARIMIYTGFML